MITNETPSMVDANGLSYIPKGKVLRFEADDQPPNNWPIWIKIEHVPMVFYPYRNTNRRWVRVFGRQLTNDGTPLEPVEVLVWLEALPRHEPMLSDAFCDLCDDSQRTTWPCEPAKWWLHARYDDDRPGLHRHLEAMLNSTPRLPGESPQEAHERIIGWAPQLWGCP